MSAIRASKVSFLSAFTVLALPLPFSCFARLSWTILDPFFGFLDKGCALALWIVVLGTLCIRWEGPPRFVTFRDSLAAS